MTSTTSTRTVNGICHHDCPDSCGWTVTVEGEGQAAVAVKLRGNPDHPYSYGELCPKVNRFLDRVYSPDRVLHPLRRVGPKGSGQFEQITWDEALAEIGSRLNAIIAEHDLDPKVRPHLREQIKRAVDLPHGAKDIAAEFGIDR